jgi:hypothetical protein
MTPLALMSSILVVLAAACGGGSAADPRPENGRYENRTVRYSFEYPQQWPDASDKIKLSVAEANVLDNVAVGAYNEETGFFDGVHVFVVKLSETVNAEDIDHHLEQLDDIYRRQAEAVGGRLQTPTTVELGGLKARQYIIEFVYGGLAQVQTASAQTVTFWGDRQYAVNCQGSAATWDEKVLPGCEQVLQTFRFR